MCRVRPLRVQQSTASESATERSRATTADNGPHVCTGVTCKSLLGSQWGLVRLHALLARSSTWLACLPPNPPAGKSRPWRQAPRTAAPCSDSSAPLDGCRCFQPTFQYTKLKHRSSQCVRAQPSAAAGTTFLFILPTSALLFSCPFICTLHCPPVTSSALFIFQRFPTLNDHTGQAPARWPACCKKRNVCCKIVAKAAQQGGARRWGECIRGTNAAWAAVQSRSDLLTCCSVNHTAVRPLERSQHRLQARSAALITAEQRAAAAAALAGHPLEALPPWHAPWLAAAPVPPVLLPPSQSGAAGPAGLRSPG